MGPNPSHPLLHPYLLQAFQTNVRKALGRFHQEESIQLKKTLNAILQPTLHHPLQIFTIKIAICDVEFAHIMKIEEPMGTHEMLTTNPTLKILIYRR